MNRRRLILVGLIGVAVVVVFLIVKDRLPWWREAPGTIPVPSSIPSKAVRDLSEEKLDQLFSSLQISKVSSPKLAPDFFLRNLAGQEVSLSDYRGDFVFLNIWATRCPPCRQEMPEMEKIWTLFKDRHFVVLAVDLRESTQKVASFIRDNHYTFPVLLDGSGKVGQIYKIQYIPTSFFIDFEGRIVGALVGPRNWTSKEMLEFLRSLPLRENIPD